MKSIKNIYNVKSKYKVKYFTAINVSDGKYPLSEKM